MGTNYYLEHPACDTCYRPDTQHHICKSLVMFQGYEVGDTYQPLGAIQSWSTWKDVLRGYTGVGWRIVDEYGDQHDCEQFITDVEATDPAARRRQYDWIQNNEPPEHRDGDWLDPDGFSFYNGEFS